MVQSLWIIVNLKVMATKGYSIFPQIQNSRFGLVGFNGMTTIVGYLMPNPLYTYIN